MISLSSALIMEYKDHLVTMDLALPAAYYDMRISLAAEKSLDNQVQNAPPQGWTNKRVNRRRSYTRRDQSIAWQLNVTEVTTSYSDTNRPSSIAFEFEIELNASTTLQLINENSEEKLQKLIKSLAQQLWWMLNELNPLSDILDVEGFLRDHPNKEAVKLAQAQCGGTERIHGQWGKVV
jgi:hypothetical protein